MTTTKKEVTIKIDPSRALEVIKEVQDYIQKIDHKLFELRSNLPSYIDLELEGDNKDDKRV